MNGYSKQQRRAPKNWASGVMVNTLEVEGHLRHSTTLPRATPDKTKHLPQKLSRSQFEPGLARFFSDNIFFSPFPFSSCLVFGVWEGLGTSFRRGCKRARRASIGSRCNGMLVRILGIIIMCLHLQVSTVKISSREAEGGRKPLPGL